MKHFEYGSCIVESEKLRLKLGKGAKIIEGWAEVDGDSDYARNLMPNKEFLKQHFPGILRKLKDINFEDYPKVLEHTWVKYKGKIVDPTLSQFRKYGGVIRYYAKTA